MLAVNNSGSGNALQGERVHAEPHAAQRRRPPLPRLSPCKFPCCLDAVQVPSTPALNLIHTHRPFSPSHPAHIGDALWHTQRGYR